MLRNFTECDVGNEFKLYERMEVASDMLAARRRTNLGTMRFAVSFLSHYALNSLAA